MLLLIDFVNPLDFPGAQRISRPAVAAARHTARLKARLTARGVQAIYANDNFGAWRSEFSRLVESCRRRRGPSRQLVELLAPAPSDIAVLKPRHSAFFAAPLAVLLAQLGARRVARRPCVLYADIAQALRWAYPSGSGTQGAWTKGTLLRRRIQRCIAT